MARVIAAIIGIYIIHSTAEGLASNHSAQRPAEVLTIPAERQPGIMKRELNGHTEEENLTSTSAARSRPVKGTNQGGSLPLGCSILFPLLSASALMWLLNKNRQMCCSDYTVFDDAIPSEVILNSNKEKEVALQTPDIELQCIVGTHRSTASLKEDPVAGRCMLNQSDRTDESSQERDSSFSWMEESSETKYRYMND